MRDGKIPSDRLTLADLPSAVEGWSHRAIVFAHTFDGYAHVGGGGPGPLWERLVGPAFEAFAHSRQIPELSLDDLRAIIFYLARADRQGGGYGPEGVQLSLYLAALDRIRSLLAARAHHGRMDHLEADYRRIARRHRGAILKMTARSSLPASVTRVFRATTKDALVSVLAELPVDELPILDGEPAFRQWFERHLDTVAACILTLNPPEVRPGIHPGFMWGHSTKVLALYVRDVVLFSRYFADADVERIAPWLYCPIDGIVLDRLRRLGEHPGASLIREIETSEHYWRLQDRLGAAAEAVGVPRVWFDDVWGDRVLVADD